MNTISAAGSDMRICNLHNDTVCYIATGRLEDPVQDHGEVYDVTHHASNILLAVTRESEPLVDVLCVHSPPAIYVVYPIRELVGGSFPVRTIGKLIR